MTVMYRTLSAPSVAEIEAKRSRFRAEVCPVGDEAQARAVVERARREFWDARHHCSAFVLGPAGDLRRSNDDGEPSGTAGMPMLDVLTGAGLTDVVAVVTRWFGGTLLGTGGLVKAYGEAVRAALDEAPVRRFERMDLVTVTLDVVDAGRVENALRAAGAVVTDVEYGRGDGRSVLVRVAVADRRRSSLEATLAELTGGGVAFVPNGETWAQAEG